MKIMITGATGFVGVLLTETLLTAGHQVKVLSRSKEGARKKLPKEVEILEWHAPYEDIPNKAFSDVDALINLMGENIGGKRWSNEQKTKLRDSRVKGTEKLAEAIRRDKPEGLDVMVSTSAIGYYPVNKGIVLDENHSNGTGFLPSLCQDWEQTAYTIAAKRKVVLRVGVVLGKGGGALAKLLPIFKLGLGGPVLPGTQVMSWIHRHDLINLYINAATNNTYLGAINAVAPRPVTNGEFTKALAKAVSRPAFFPVPSFALKLAMGEMSTIVLDSQTVVSTKLGNLGFRFTYPEIEEALKNL